MAKRGEKKLLVGLDIGTSKIVAVVGEVNENNAIEIIGFGQHPSRLKRGIIVNIESTVVAMARAIEEAELMAGCEIRSVSAGISGLHIRSFNSHGIASIRENEICSDDVERVLDAAQAVAIPADQKILHVLPQEFIIDNEGGIREPWGMSGVRLEAKVHIITGAVSASQNIVKCVQRCNVMLSDMVLDPLAASQAVLTEDEKDLGVCLLDIGAGTTSIIIFHEGSVRHTAVLPVAGDQVTNDIAVALRTSSACAEELKIQHACALTAIASAEESIDVPTVGERPPRKISRRLLAEVVEPRYEELFALVYEELRRSGVEEMIRSGIVLIGGGAKMSGVVELAEEIFHMPVRLGYPHEHVTGLLEVIENPLYATGVGLLLHSHLQQVQQGPVEESSPSVAFKNAWVTVKNWFQRSF